MRLTSNSVLFSLLALILLMGIIFPAKALEIPDDFFDQAPFIIVVQTDHQGVSGTTEFSIPTNGNYHYEYEVDWTYDGSTFNAESRNVTGDISHDYRSAGTYTIAIRGQFPQIFFNDDPANPTRNSDAQKLVDIEQWGEIEWLDLTFSFFGCENLLGSATDGPDLSQANSLKGAFLDCTSLIMDVSQWEVGTIENFSGTFMGSTSFNADVTGWNVGSGTDFSNMFSGASAFNQDLSGWDLSSTTVLDGFLDDTGLDENTYGATLNGWSVQSFPSGLTIGVNGLNYCQGEVSRKMLIDSLGWVFQGDQKDCPLVFVVKTDNPGTNTSSTQYRIPVHSSEVYNYQVDWTYDGVTFQVEDDNVTDSITHDYGTPGTYTIAIRGEFAGFYNNVGFGKADPEKFLEVQQWGSIEWKRLLAAFSGCTNLEMTATDLPDFSQVSLAINMFQGCINMQGNNTMAYWDVSHLTQANGMFAGARSFNQDIGAWDVGNVRFFSSMFSSAAAFNQDIGDWDVSSGEDFVGMFSFTDAFNQDLSTWDVSSGNSFKYMFDRASAFNQNLGQWNMASADDLGFMLRNCGMSATNYDLTLIGWAAKTLPNDLTLDANGLRYCNGEMARFSLINDNNWTINGDAFDCSGIGGDCPASRVVNSTDIAPGVTLKAAFSLTTNGLVAISAGDDVTFTAGESIRLLPGFSAQGPFAARIADCMESSSIPSATEESVISGHYPALPFGKKDPNQNLQVFPNPSFGQFTLRFVQATSGQVWLTLHSLKGRTIKTLLEGQFVDQGVFDVEVAHHDLPPGMYLARLQNKQSVQTVKISVSGR